MDPGRGMKKKIKLETNSVYDFQEDAESKSKKQKKVSDCFKQQRKRMNRFDGLSDEEVMKRTLPDHLAYGLDMIIIGINPGLFAAYKGHHYAGPGNHFWKCLYLGGLISEPMTATDDYKLLQYGIGFTNIVQRATKGSADLSKKELREGVSGLLQKLKNYQPKIAAFNGKLIYEAFTGKKKFGFGLQDDPVQGTDIRAFVMPSSSARCAQLPRATDKVPYYAALKRLRDYLRGDLPDLDMKTLVFPDVKQAVKVEVKREPDTENGDTRGSGGAGGGGSSNGTTDYFDASGNRTTPDAAPPPKKKYYPKKKKLPIYSPPPVQPKVEPPEPQEYDSTLGDNAVSPEMNNTPQEEEYLHYSLPPPPQQNSMEHNAHDMTDPYSQVSPYAFPTAHPVVSPYFSTPTPPPVSTCNGNFASLTPVSPELLAPSPHPPPVYGFQSPLGWGCETYFQSQPPFYGQQFLTSPGLDRVLTPTEIKLERPD